MSAPETAVLYDAPGPRAKRRSVIGSLVATVVILGLLYVVYDRLADQGQFSMELWGPFIDPSHEEFALIWQLIGRGIRATLTAAALAIVFSLVIGTLIAVVRLMLGKWSRMPVVGLVELLRGLPVVITIYYASRVLPDIGVNVGPLPGSDGLWYVVIGLTAYNSVIIAEIVRAGVQSLPRGQREAGMSIGMSPWQVMSVVLLPQAFRTMLPALISQLVVILKDTSLAAVLGIYTELLKTAQPIYQRYDNPIQAYVIIGAIFILMNFALSRLAVWLERRLATRGSSQRTGAEAMEAGVGQGA